MSGRPPASERGDPDERSWLAVAADRRAADAEVGERLEVERATTPWCARLAPCRGHELALRTVDGTTHAGLLVDVGDGWALLEAAGRARLVMLGEVVSVVSDEAGSPGAPPRILRGTGSVYRRWGRLRAPTTLALRDGTRVRGVIVEVLHDALTVRPEEGPDALVLLPFSGVVWALGEPLDE